MVGGAQRESSHFCSKRQVPLPFSPHVPFCPPSSCRISPRGPLCLPPLWLCGNCSSLLRVPGLTCLSGFSRERSDHPQGFSTARGKREEGVSFQQTRLFRMVLLTC